MQLNPRRRACNPLGFASVLMNKLLFTLRARLDACAPCAYHHAVNQ